MEDVKRKAVGERDEVKQSKTTHPYGNAVAKPTASNAINCFITPSGRCGRVHL